MDKLLKAFHKGFRVFSWGLLIIGAVTMSALVLNALQIPIRLVLPGNPEFAILLATLLTALMLGITLIIHEAGHFMAARLQGMTVTEVKLGWLFFSARRKGFKVQFKRQGSSFGGWVKATVGKGSIRRQMLVLVLGGPAINLVCATTGGALTWAAFIYGAKSSATVLASFSVMNAYMGFANLLPIGRTIPSDGSRLYHWLFESHKDPAALSLYRLMGLSVQGLRARDYSAEDLGLLTESPMPTRRLLGKWLALRGAIDRKDMTTARNLLKECRSLYEGSSEEERKILAGTWAFCLLESAYLEGRLEGSREEGRLLLENSDLQAIPAFMRLRLEAVMHAAAGDRKQAQDCIDRARVDLDETHDIGTRLEEIDLLDDLSTQLQT